MEVGAVKQAYNNEIIILKKKLNQAKIHIIHKLTRKAKTLTEKQVPEQLKVKFTKKAESAVKEVLIIKKIKARDVAKFIVTHKGELNGYLNRPTVDQDKACARLLLHKALQDKYKVIRERFSNIPIKDLLMSRQERLKLKKEAREKLNKKKKGKDANEPVQAEGDWDVENIVLGDSQLNASDNDSYSSEDIQDKYDQVDDKDEGSENESSDNNAVLTRNIILDNNVSNSAFDDSNEESNESNNVSKISNDLIKHVNEHDKSEEDSNVGKLVKYSSCLADDNIVINKKDVLRKLVKSNENNNKNSLQKKHKDSNKNKNLNNKISLKKFNKEKSEMPIQESKVVDTFFITATGENYMSVAEPRQPDEVKEVHKQGNRKYRRAVMFGNVPKVKPRRDDIPVDNSKFSKFEDNSSRGKFSASLKNNAFNKYGTQKRFGKSDDSDQGNFKDTRNDYKKNIVSESKGEKLHPSWEAKKRQSSILPFQGKKIIFDEG